MLNVFRDNDPPNVFRFSLKLEYVENRSVRRSLDFEDDTDNTVLWYVRCVPIGHSAMFYLCRNAYPEYYEFIYDYMIVSGDSEIISGFERRAMVDPTQLCEEYMDPTIPIPVNPSKNWFLLQIKVLHLTPAEFSTNQNENALTDSINNLRIERPPAQPSATKTENENQLLQSDKLLSLTMFSNRMLSMFSNQLCTDMSVKCNSKTFLAHKSILSAHSIVFRTMFEHTSTKESLTSEIVIEEFDYHAVLIMLQWFYCSEVCLPYPDVRELYLSGEQCSCAEDEQGTSQSTPSCSCHILNDELLLEVTELAHKYALDEMQFQCEEEWTQRLNLKNIFDCLYYAELFQLYSLKLSCTEMIRQNTEIMSNDRWTQLVEWQPEIGRRICAALDIEPSTSKSSD